MTPRSAAENEPRSWIIHRPAAATDSDLSIQHATGVHPVVARILAARGYADLERADSFLRPRLGGLVDPFELADMRPAAERVVRAIERRERVCVFGDYDVDGLTATAVMVSCLTELGGDVFPYVPSRLREGYGLSRDAIDACAAQGARLIVTVDNGITAWDEIAHANRLGIDVVVTDHHQPGARLPEAVAVVNPNRTDAYYPHARLAGVGVAFKLAHAVLKVRGVTAEEGRAILGGLLDLVALGTLADIVPLYGENRILARWGLERLGQAKRTGLRALLELAGHRERPVTSDTVSYVLAPRLNAAGRTAEPAAGLQILLEDDPHEAIGLARHLEQLNEERKVLERDILQNSIDLLESRGQIDTDMVLVAEGEGWHTGVLGIVAARIVGRYGRPVVVLAIERDLAVGSARSVAGYNIHEALSTCEDHLLSFGGHAAAAGLRLRPGDVPKLRRTINEHARETVGDAFRQPPLDIDTQVLPGEITLDLIEGLRVMEPFGTDNPEPMLILESVRVKQPPRIVGNGHLRIFVTSDEKTFVGIGFGMGSQANLCAANADDLDVAFVPRANEWRGDTTVELELRALRPGRSRRS